MLDDQAFLDTIAASPAEDGPRLVYADWLEEHGETARACGHRLAVQLRRVIAAPDDDGPRLEYARVCEMYGRLERAEFIRVQIDLADRGNVDVDTNQPGTGVKRTCRCDPRMQICGLCAILRDKADDLLNAYHPTGNDETGNPTNGFVWALPIEPSARPRYRRGFVEEVTVDWDRWAGYVIRAFGPRTVPGRAAEYLTAAPLRRVTLTDAPPRRLGRVTEKDWGEGSLWFLGLSRDMSVGNFTETVQRRTAINRHSAGILVETRKQLQDELDKDCTLEAWCRRRWPSVMEWAFQQTAAGRPVLEEETDQPEFGVSSRPLPITGQNYSGAVGNQQQWIARRGRRG